MKNLTYGSDAILATNRNEEKNLEIIRDAKESGRIDDATCKYMNLLYSDSMSHFREVFLHIGKCFGAPKAPVRAYDFATDSIITKPITISEINPLSPYLVNHRLDLDPMRNQFFKTTNGHNINLAVSSIVTVIVGAQKNVYRAIDKITNKYYPMYIDGVSDAARNVITKYQDSKTAEILSDKIREKLKSNFISDASATVLEIVGTKNQALATDLVRAIDKIRQPHKRLKDVWRAKCLFDLVPQARAFIDCVCNLWPDKILEVRDTFFDISNPRGYRDAKLFLNIGTKDNIVPMEIICQVRTFFDFEHQTHSAYELARNKTDSEMAAVERTEIFHNAGTKKYNHMINYCVADLFDRIGWNILYNPGDEDKLFDGFPVLSTIHYDSKITDLILKKVTSAVENEVFFVENAPVELTKDQEIRIFRWMARFILVTAMPYSYSEFDINTDTMAGKFFNFIMNELYRLYRK